MLILQKAALAARNRQQGGSAVHCLTVLHVHHVHVQDLSRAAAEYASVVLYVVPKYADEPAAADRYLVSAVLFLGQYLQQAHLLLRASLTHAPNKVMHWIKHNTVSHREWAAALSATPAQLISAQPCRAEGGSLRSWMIYHLVTRCEWSVPQNQAHNMLYVETRCFSLPNSVLRCCRLAACHPSTWKSACQRAGHSCCRPCTACRLHA